MWVENAELINKIFCSWGLNYGFAYDLPTNASQLSYKAYLRIERSIETKPMIQRRQRRDLFNRLEIAINQ